MTAFEERFGALRPRVREMRQRRVSYAQIAREVGVSKTTAWRLADDDHQQRYLRSTLNSFEKRVKEPA